MLAQNMALCVLCAPSLEATYLCQRTLLRQDEGTEKHFVRLPLGEKRMGCVQHWVMWVFNKKKMVNETNIGLVLAVCFFFFFLPKKKRLPSI